jgi:hypothetical protein
MNLKEWVNYKKYCPVCSSPLITYLHSQKRQSIRYEEGRMVVIFPLHSLKGKSNDHKVGYSFGLEDSSYHIEFYDKEMKRLDREAPPSLIKKFKQLNSNLGDYKFYRQCESCKRYNYASNYFKLNLKNNQLAPWELRSEYFGLIQNYGGAQDDRYRVYRLLNYYYNVGEGESFLSYWITKNAFDAMANHTQPSHATSLHLPLIRFISQEETIKRIKKLIIFS